MAATVCLDFLNNFADLLSSNTDATGIRPRPVMFSEVNCSGSAWPDPTLTQRVDADTVYTNPSSTDLGSFWLPPGWQVQFDTPSGTITIPENGPQTLPLLVTDVSIESFASDLAAVNSIQVIYPFIDNSPEKGTLTDSDWKLAMCTNKISTTVGARHLTSWQQSSAECDTFMQGYCAPVSGRSCGAGKTVPDVLPLEFRPCVCLVEENCFKEVFCEPGNSNPSCANDDAFQEFIPVTCFGKNCSAEGYRFGRMVDQRCSITLCQQIINLVGSQITVRGGATIWCGNRAIPLTSTSPPAPTVRSSGTELPEWAWALIGVAAFFLFIAVPLAVIVYRRAFKFGRSKRSGLKGSLAAVRSPAARQPVPRISAVDASEFE